jgi:hypothetical protein
MVSQNDASMPAPPNAQRHHIRQGRLRRYEPTPVYALAERLKREGVELQKIHGPWRPIQRPLRRPGRNAEKVIPIVTNGMAELVVDSAERAADLSGLLNWCGVDHLEPVPSLRPPGEDLAQD